MNSLFLPLLNMSFSASLVIAVVIVLRFLMKKAPKSFFLLLWAAAAVRLVVPFSAFDAAAWFQRAEAPASVASAPEISTSAGAENNTSAAAAPSAESGRDIQASDSAPSAATPSANETTNITTQLPVNDPTTSSATTELPTSDSTANSATTELPVNDSKAGPGSTSPAFSEPQPFLRAEMDNTHVVIVALLWLGGMAVMAGYAMISYSRLSRRVRSAVHLRENLYQSDNIDSPFLMGFLKPKIYLPASLSPADSEYVIAHEQAHLRHHDHFIKLAGFLLLTAHWFNPLVWVGYLMLCKDIELACDERVVRRGGNQIKKAYSTALINCSVPRELTNTSPLAFGERAVKERVINVLRYRKPTAAMIVACLLTSALVLASCAAPNTVSVSEKPADEKPSSSVSEPEPPPSSTDPFSPAVKAEILARMKEEADAHGGTINLKVWCATNDYKYEKSVCRKFREEYLKDADFEVVIAVKNAIGEPDAGGKIIQQKKDGADVFNFGDEQLEMLYDANAIAPVPEIFRDTVTTANSADSLAAATYEDTLLCYPKSCDNGYFLYYDKRVLSEEDVKDFDTIIAKSREQGKHVFMNLGDAWYTTGFYLAAGVKIAYQNNIQTTDFNTPEALAAAKAMCRIAENHENGFIGDPGSVGQDGYYSIGYQEGTLSAAVIGTWEARYIKDVWGIENLGAAKLPTVLIDGEQKQLHSFCGYKLVGVSEYSECPFSAHALAWYITNEQAQIDRYRARNLLPTNNSALEAGMEADDDTLKIKDDVAFKALADQKPFAHAQGETVSGTYWGLGVGTLGSDIVKVKGNMEDDILQKRLQQIQNNLEAA